MERCVVWELVLAVLVQSVRELSARGVGTRYIPVNQAQERTYPSQVRRYYYTYYMNYFLPSGLVYARDARESTRTVTLCKNYENYNDTILGMFPCPMEKDPNNFDHCCGESNYEYCCRALDHPSVKLAIGLGTTAGLGIIIGIILCLVLKVRGGKQAIDRKRSGRKKMLQMGIPKYDTLKVRGFAATQSEDGYQIVVKFCRDKKFYTKFWEELYRRNENVAWKFGDNKSVKEAKLTMKEGSWVSVVLSDDFEGRPILLVSREKAAVDWMESDFITICNAIPDDSGCFACFRRSKLHPAKQPEPKVMSHKSNGKASHAKGKASHANGKASHANGKASHANGKVSHANGKASHSNGKMSYANGKTSHSNEKSNGKARHLSGEGHGHKGKDKKGGDHSRDRSRERSRERERSKDKEQNRKQGRQARPKRHVKEY